MFDKTEREMEGEKLSRWNVAVHSNAGDCEKNTYKTKNISIILTGEFTLKNRKINTRRTFVCKHMSSEISHILSFYASGCLYYTLK